MIRQALTNFSYLRLSRNLEQFEGRVISNILLWCGISKFWNPKKHAIEFWNCDANGSLSESTVKLEEGKLVHDFREIASDGKVESLVARITPPGAAGWENEIFARKDDALAPIVKVRYEPAP